MLQMNPVPLLEIWVRHRHILHHNIARHETLVNGRDPHYTFGTSILSDWVRWIQSGYNFQTCGSKDNAHMELGSNLTKMHTSKGYLFQISDCMYVHPFASNIWDWQCNMMLQRACSCLQVKIKWCKCHGIWSWWKSWREVEEYLKRWSNLGWGSKHNGRFTSTYQNVHQSLSVGSVVTSINYYFLRMTETLFLFADWEDAYVYWCSCQFYELF